MWTRLIRARLGGSALVLAGARMTRRATLPLIFLFLAVVAIGCKPSTPPAPPAPPPPVETVARVHWLGMDRLLAETNATFLTNITSLPESKQLAKQTLDRLAVGLLATNSPPGTNPPPAAAEGAPSAPLTGVAALLRPLLEDLFRQESYLEVRHATNQPGEMVLAIRLDDERSGRWQTNLAVILQSRTGHIPALGQDGRSWQLPLASHPAAAADDRCLTFGRRQDWVLIGLGPETNLFMAELAALIDRDGQPFARQPKDFWLYANLDPQRTLRALALDWSLPPGLPKVTVTAIGDRGNVRTAAALNFPQPLPFNLEPWNIPTNLLHEPIVSFTAIQGLTTWLSALPVWRNLQLGSPPGQLYFWAQSGVPFLSYCAATLPDCSNRVTHVTDLLVNQANAWLTNNGLGRFDRATNYHGVNWADLAIVSPYLKTRTQNGVEFAFAGLESDLYTNRPSPAGLLQQVSSITNLVAYDWELTGPRLEQWLYVGQLLRFALYKAQIPPKSASFAWLSALETRLGNCGTVVTRTGPDQLSFLRNSGIGLNSAELDLLADWLESPQFPRGLHTFLGKPTPLPKRKSGASPRPKTTPPAPKG
ncbi:MAG TPA: hypothetical protein PLV05_04125 [Verrucomicrobiota bacterium]|nr:hypothetical protein [Verrucomicrobiota bacterium]HRR64465.1 hypothetical protein [Candidatus Paceibacterota bacterium]NLH84740.1 hypothetical protein [Verrucomicrobiota bacterium]HNR71620.1 hypothetical protein [Verrucomicrobiota bacterium]HNS70246.1 hypothetical protein [Verrucomicrobiota bacterium]